MRLGISSYTFSWAIGVRLFPQRPTQMDAMGLLEKAIALDVRVLQVADNLPLVDLSEENLEAFTVRASEANVSIEVGTRGIDHDNLRAYLRLAERFGSPFVRVVVDKGDDEPTPEQCIERLTPLLPEFAASHVKIAIENHDRYPAATLKGIVEALNEIGERNIGPPDTPLIGGKPVSGPPDPPLMGGRGANVPYVGICLDTVNSFGSLEGPKYVVETLAPLAINLHVKDFEILRVNHQMGFSISGTVAGQGRLDIPWLLTKVPTDITAVLELWMPFVSDIYSTVMYEEKWAEASVKYLKETVGEQ